MSTGDLDRLAPEFKVMVDGGDLPAAAAADVLWASVDEDVDAPGMFRMELLNWNPDTLDMKWSDDDLFEEGRSVEILMGYRDRLQTLIAGEITGLELSVRADAATTLVVHGYDRSHRLQRGRRTRAFTNVTDSEIARRVGEGAGLTVEAEQTDQTFEYVMQSNQTDFEFLKERAGAIGFEIVVRDRTLLFRPRQTNTDAAAVIAADRDLLEFHTRLTTIGQAAAVELRGWSPRRKSPIVARASADDVTKVGSDTVGIAAVQRLFGDAVAVGVTRPFVSDAEARSIAVGQMNEMALAYVTGQGACVGRTDVRAGRMVTIEGVGRRFGGVYYVTSAVHSYRPDEGYRTRFVVRRNAS